MEGICWSYTETYVPEASLHVRIYLYKGKRAGLHRGMYQRVGLNCTRGICQSTLWRYRLKDNPLQDRITGQDYVEESAGAQIFFFWFVLMLVGKLFLAGG